VPANLDYFIETKTSLFYEELIEKLTALNLSDLIKKNNIYLIRTKYILFAHDLVKFLIDDYLSTIEERLFNDFLKQLAIFTATQVYSARESTYPGIALEITKDGTDYLIFIEASRNPNQNHEFDNQIGQLLDAKQLKSEIIPGSIIKAIYGSVYGFDNQPDKGDYLMFCGQKFWKFISGDPNYYLKIMELTSIFTPRNNEMYDAEYCRILNILEAEFLNAFCQDGVINWPKLVKLNSSSDHN